MNSFSDLLRITVQIYIYHSLLHLKRNAENIFEKDLKSITNSVKLKKLEFVNEQFKTHNQFNFLLLSKGIDIADGSLANDLSNHNAEIDRNSTEHSNHGSAMELSDSMSLDETGVSQKHQHCISKSKLTNKIEKELMHKHVHLVKLRRELDHVTKTSLIVRVNYNIERLIKHLYKAVCITILSVISFHSLHRVTVLVCEQCTYMGWILWSVHIGSNVIILKTVLKTILNSLYEHAILISDKYIEKNSYPEVLLGLLQGVKTIKQAITKIWKLI